MALPNLLLITPLFRLACSFFTYALLASYWVQSELGDWDLYQGRGRSVDDYLPTSESTVAGPPIDYLGGMPLAAPPDTESEERDWIASTTGPPYPPPLVRLTPAFLGQVAHFHRFLR